jgi:superfamily I DNA/RNA helicase
MFTWTEQELNSEQREAIFNEDSILLVACPGSGKTKTLTYKIAYELSRLKSEKNYIVAITYTHRAADEIEERIESLGVNTSRLWIGTIHSFCLEWIIKPYGLYLPELARGYRVIDQHEKEKLLKGLCAQYSALGITIYDCEYYFTDAGYVLGCPDQTKHAALHLILKSYFKIIAKNRQIDFELILWHAYQLIAKNNSICSLLSKIFTMILVDEYQDTKQIQYKIITSILRAGGGASKLFIVGDPNQAIYGSLGGYPIPLHELRTLLGFPITELALSLNYRSSEKIVKYFGNFNLYETAVTANGDNRYYPSLISYNNNILLSDLVAEIVRLIRYNVETLGISPEEICVLAPQWVHLATMTRNLVANMPEYSFDGPGLVPFARDIENFWYKLSRIALTEPSPTMYVRRLRWASETLRDLKDFGVSTPDVTPKTLLRMCNSINIAEIDGLKYLNQFFDTLLSCLNINLNSHLQLLEHHRAFFDSSESRLTRLEKEGVDQIREVGYFKRVFQNRSGITVSTIHGVKGGEFDVVIAFALLEGMVPHFNDANGEESAKKMLYVLGSRARKNLHLFSESGRRRRHKNFYSATKVLRACDFNYDNI